MTEGYYRHYDETTDTPKTGWDALAVEQAIRQLQGQSVSDNVSPPILVLTPKNADREHIRRSLSPGGFRPVYFYQHTSAAKK